MNKFKHTWNLDFLILKPRTMNEEHKSHSSFKNFNRILMTTLVLVTVIFVIIYFTVRNQTLFQIYGNEQQLVSNISHSSSIIQSEAQTSMYNLYDNPQTMQLIYSVDTGRIETLRAMLMLKNHVANSSWVDSSYIFNAKAETVVYSYVRDKNACLSFCDLDDFYDTSAINLFSAGQPTKSPIMRTVTSPNGISQTVLTYGIRVVRYTFDGLFIINIPVDHLLELSKEFTDDQARQIMIAVNANSVYSSDYQILSEEDTKTLLDRIFSADESSGQFISHELDVICTWNRVPDSKLLFISCVPHSQVSAALNILLRWYLVFFVIILLFSALDVLLLSKNTQNYEALRKKYTRISKQYHDNYNVIKNSVLRNFLAFDSSQFQIEDQFQDNEIRLESFANYSVTLLNVKQIISEDGVPNIPYPTLFAFLFDTFQKNIPEKIQFELVDMLQGHYLLISEYTKAEELTTMLQTQIAEYSTQNILEISCISELNLPNLNCLPESYRRLHDHLEFMFFYPHGSCILLANMKKRTMVGYQAAKDLSLHLQPVLDKQNFTEAEQMLCNFFDLWFEPLEQVRNTLSLLVSKMEAFISAFQQSKMLTFQFDKESFLNTLLRCNSSSRVKLHFSNLITDLSTAFESITNRNTYAEQILDMMNQRYSEENFSVNEIADALGLSISYTQTVFKSATGSSISTCLRQLRLKKAEELLLSTDYSVNEISKRVGLDNANHFYTIFKKHYGLTPVEYRKSNTRKSIGDR